LLSEVFVPGSSR